MAIHDRVDYFVWTIKFVEEVNMEFISNSIIDEYNTSHDDMGQGFGHE
jgi:hypothetical protein